MKRQSILFILLLLLTLISCSGCAGAEKAAPDVPEAVPEEASAVMEETSFEEASLTGNSELEKEILEEQRTANSLGYVEDVSGIFEGLEDNHTALFSFDGVEIPFFFEDSNVRTVLSEAVVGSTYTLSYHYDESLGLNVIYEISE